MKMLIDLTDEYIERQGRVSCEISMENLSNEIGFLLIELNKKLKPLNSGWIIKPCETCVEYYPDKPFHLEIERFMFE